MMSRALIAPTLAAGFALAGAAHAQTAPARAEPSPNVVSGVEVAPTAPPAITSTFPAAGATIAPGVLVLKLVFDQPMAPGEWSYAKAGAGDYPACLQTPRLLSDNRTFVLLCTTTANGHYGVGVNQAPDTGFANPGNHHSAPFELSFSTSAAEPVRTVKDAMAAAGLGDLDMPVETPERATPPASPAN